MMQQRQTFLVRQTYDYLPIRDYSLIGDCRTAALVATDASLDWLCLPHFDSQAAFCRLLDARVGGFFALSEPESDTSPAPLGQRYLPRTAILETDVALTTGTLRVTDFMPVGHLRGTADMAEASVVVRRIEALTGNCRFAVRLKASPDYARGQAEMTADGAGLLVAGGAGVLVLAACDGMRSDGTLEAAPGGPWVWVHTLAQGETLTLALSWADDMPQARSLRTSLAGNWTAEMEATRAYWDGWSAATRYHGVHAEIVARSAITLKLMTFAPTGAIVAAPTTSLPEFIGGPRNWDYRYTWLRDASFTAIALALLGHRTEARAFVRWVLDHACRDRDELHILYNIHGNPEVPESEVAELEGYRASRPVRVGNAAAKQLQLDIAGEWLDCVAALYLDPEELEASALPDGHTEPIEDQIPPSPRLRGVVECAVDFVCDHWRERDSGIWESRGPRQHFVYSKVLCWTALDRAIKLAEHFGWQEPLARWKAERQLVEQNLLAHALDPETQTFRISYERAGVDAALLMLPLVGFIAADDPRMVATTNTIAEHLTGPDGLVHRYHYREFNDGMAGAEGSFMLCSFWMVENLALQGRRDEALAMFNRLTNYLSPTGLLSEMVDPATGELLGNFPQAFSHLGLIRSALALAGEPIE